MSADAILRRAKAATVTRVAAGHGRGLMQAVVLFGNPAGMGRAVSHLPTRIDVRRAGQQRGRAGGGRDAGRSGADHIGNGLRFDGIKTLAIRGDSVPDRECAICGGSLVHWVPSFAGLGPMDGCRLPSARS